MVLTNKQELGLRIALERYKSKEKYTVISGYAGTGKTTLVKHLVAALDIEEQDVIYCAFTGKACTVLQNKGNKNVSTLHRLLWEWRPKSDGTFFRTKKEIGEKLVIVDEVSMVSKDLVLELLSRPNIHVIFLGDPGQLPPIDKNNFHVLLDHPHIFLDEIMRQAAESEIIRLTMDIREGKPLQKYQGKEVMILDKEELSESMLTWADQVLCATNKTRAGLNQKMRQLAGFTSLEPQTGDKIICVQNYWDEVSINKNPNFDTNTIIYPTFYDSLKVDTITTEFLTDAQDLFTVTIDKNKLMTEQPTYPTKIKYNISRNKNWAETIPLEFVYAYAITCHKSQGSEWEKVLVVEESFPFDKEEHKRWLYTAATRASEKLVIIRK